MILCPNPENQPLVTRYPSEYLELGEERKEKRR